MTEWAYYPGKTPGHYGWYVLQESGRIVPSASWEAAREGVDDLRYDATARHWIAEARRVSLAAEADGAEAVRKAFFATMPDYYHTWRDNFTPAEYDARRLQIARRIGQLVRRLERHRRASEPNR